MTSRTLAALALAGALGLAGCGGDPEPKVAEPVPSPPASSPTASPSVSETADPEQAYRDFIESYVDAISRSLSTGDPSEWLAMSSPECENCSIYADNLRAAYADGGRIDGGLWTLERVRFKETTSVGEVWYGVVQNRAERWLNADGTLSKEVPAGTNYFAFAVVGEPNAFVMRELRFREP